MTLASTPICKLGGINLEKREIKNWTIAIIVAVIYLVVSIVFNIWEYSWLIWVAYAIYRFIVK